MQDWLANLTPQYWQFWLGLVLVVIVLVGRERMARWGRCAVPARSAARGSGEAMTAALETIGVERSFGGIVATNDVSLAIEHGARHALIGPNGAGKTTFVNLLTGMLASEPAAASCSNGEDITALTPLPARASRHRAHVPDQPAVRRPDAARDDRARGVRAPGIGIADWWRPPGSNPDVIDAIVEILERFRLAPVMHERTATLPYGRQRLLEIALACACKPRVLLLDEPAAGVPTGESAEILDTLAALPDDVSVLLIEHDMDLVFRFASRISVLVDGTRLSRTARRTRSRAIPA